MYGLDLNPRGVLVLLIIFGLIALVALATTAWVIVSAIRERFSKRSGVHKDDGPPL